MRATSQQKPRFHSRLQTLAQGLLVLGSAATLTLAHAALTDISQSPVITAAGTPVKPNVLFTLDDSGSMEGDYLPEAADFSGQLYGSHTSQCNGMAFNPGSTYAVPVDSTGTPVAEGSISAAMRADVWLSTVNSVSGSNLAQVSSGSLTITANGTSNYTTNAPVTIYDANDKTRWMIGMITSWTSSTRKLVIAISDSSGTATQADPYVGQGWPPFVYFTYSGTQSALGYTYKSTGAVENTATFYKECSSKIGASPGSGVFTKVVVRASDGAMAQKLANWRAYYSTRLLMMKTIVSQVFKDIDDNYRVGFATIHSTQAKETTSKDFLHIRDFDATQKANFYSYLNATTSGGSTPLRGALTLAGRYYAKKARNQGTNDPVQYSCQKNFNILATDGMWNTGNEDSSVEFGPYKLSGTTTVGQQDSAVDKPYRDASQGGSSGGSTDSLADIAMYYYATDLRTSALGNCTGAIGVDVCANNIKSKTGDKDTADWQHLNTYTMSLGQNGFRRYDPAYETQTTGDFYQIKQGGLQWPNPVLGSDTDPGKMDDLWHAAVNGRGLYFNAADPVAVAQGLQTALAKMDPKTATGSAAATSALQPVLGNNQVFVASFTTPAWIGDLRAYRMDPGTGAILVTDPANPKIDLAQWSAATKLQTNTSRNIYYAKGTTLRAFTYANLNADGYAADFDDSCTSSKLTQCSALDSTAKTTANSGTNLVNYLRGTEFTTAFRARERVLGDIVGSSPVYVGASPFKTTDTSFAAHDTATQSRRPMVYVGANDGMLHAFDATYEGADAGKELWAFIPTAVRSNLYKLADNNYTTNHRFFVDGSPSVADVKIGGAWKTILVSGLGAGGKAYFALDVTDPASPKLLWEFTDANLGLTFGSPQIVQRPNGDWVVVFSSGYNNTGDGAGHLFMLDAATGSKLFDLTTATGSAASPSGLGPIAAWTRGGTENSAKRYYAGDTLGNVWRFDPENLLGFTNKTVKLAQLLRSGVAQPVATKPVLAEINYKGFISTAVFLGTGKMLGLTDIENVDTQSIYGIRDPLASSGWGDVRAGNIVAQTLTTSGSTRTATKNPVDWANKIGWYVDLPDAGERINIDMMLRYNTLVAGSNVPKSVASCLDANDGYAWLYYLDITFGSNTGTTVATKLTDSMVVGLGAYDLANGTGGVVATFSQGNPTALSTPKPRTFLKTARKSNWRELMDR